MRSRRDVDTKGAGSPSGSREVNTLLHTLRGEHFRHAQNLRKSRAHLASAAAHTYNDPSLPFSDVHRFAHLAPSTPRGGRAAPPPHPIIRDGHLEYDFPRGPVPGPPPPQSWGGLFKHGDGQEGGPAASDPARDNTMPAFRRRALSLVFSHTPWSFGSSDVPLYDDDSVDARGAVPPLAQICLRVLLAMFPDAVGFEQELLPALPSYFRRDVLRYTAVHDPLPNAKLYPLLQPEGHADGELIVVGPQATLQRDLLLSLSQNATARRVTAEEEEPDDRGEGPSSNGNSGHDDGGADDTTEDAAEASDEDESSWEADSSSQETSPQLHTIIVLNAPVHITTLFSFPPVLTRLALVALPAPTPVHRLPRICPLLVVLDLSYNPWLNEPPGGQGAESASETVAQRVEWTKWARLRVLGLRGCDVPRDVLMQVNRGRWDEVEIVLDEPRAFRTTMGDVEAMMRGLRLND
ncbi:hypothetical protein C2E23DRAFT_914859 [Lenzites betulinus]|nr:hypothetical protein C2E23DRAFT_914859 [Lenzites betulinus]